MSEHEIEGGGSEYAVEPVEDGVGEEFVGPSRAEWEDAQERLAQANELVEAVRWGQEREQAEELAAERQAALEFYVGDPIDDRAGYAERVREMAIAEAEAHVAPLVEWFESQAQERALAEGDAMADRLIAGHAERLGVEIDAATAKAEANDALRAVFEQYVEGGMAPQDAYAVVFSPYAAEEALRLHAEQVAHEQALRGGDETSVVAKYFRGPSGQGVRPAAAQYQNADQRALAEQVLRGT